MTTDVAKQCVTCGVEFTVKAYRAQRAKACSRACVQHQRGDLSKLFWAKVDKRGPDECWEWQAAKVSGYGTFGTARHIGKNTPAHRFSWQEANGPIPDGMVICHRCDNPPCVNPSHLFVGTHQDNVADKTAKQRVPRGSGHHHTKLTEADVRRIRALPRSYAVYHQLAAEYGMCADSIRTIAVGATWKHVV